MTSRHILRISSALLLTTLSFGAAAAPKDAAATTKIDEAINVHYLATDFAKAETQLLGVVKACGKDGCSPNIVARAWMYVGLVRGSGKQDLPAAREAFTKAKEADASVALDSALATPEVQTEFNAIMGGGGGSAAASGESGAGGNETAKALAAASPPAEPGDAECTPAPDGEIEIRRPIPISCKAPAGATKGVLAFKEFGSTEFTNFPMTLQDGLFKAPIPCSATKMQGTLQYVIVLKDDSGTPIATLGDLENPAKLKIVTSTKQAPPAFPGEEPPARCAEEVECPPGMPGCAPKGGGGWGDSCTPAEPCKTGLYCSAGTCANAPTCEADSDCDSGHCKDGFCEMPDGSADSSSTEFRRFWVGIHGAADLAFMGSGSDVCNVTSIGNDKYDCFYSGTKIGIRNDLGQTIPGIPNQEGMSGSIKGGAILATVRVLASFDYAILPNISAGARLGFAFGGGPQGLDYVAGPNNTVAGVKKGKSFLPVHAELRGTYWFTPLNKKTIHPYVGLGGGLAQVDAQMRAEVRNCVDAVGTKQAPCSMYNDYKVDVYKRYGQGFATLFGGVMIPITAQLGLQANLNAMYMLPISGIVLEPSLGGVFGF